MSNDTQVIECGHCSAKLRVAATAIGKTINCPKCGQKTQAMVNSQPVKQLVVAKPIAAPSAAVPMIDPLAQPSAMPGPGWNNLQFQTPGAPALPYGASKAAAGGKSSLGLWLALGGTAFVVMLSIAIAGLILFSARGRSTPTGPVGAVPPGFVPPNSSRPGASPPIGQDPFGAPSQPGRIPTGPGQQFNPRQNPSSELVEVLLEKP